MASSDAGVDVVMIDYDAVSDYNPDQILPESPGVIREIREWLRPTSYNIAGSEYRKHTAAHVAGTGTWLTASTTYNDWLQSDNHGILWIKGIPGSGKSVIAANLVSQLSKENPGCPILFFFFRQIIEANHTPQALLRDWLDQVLAYSPPLQQKLKPLNRHGSAADLSMDKLWSYLRMALSNLRGKAFCVADALDEMDGGNDEFLQTLVSLGQWKPDKIKVLITSRPVANVERPLRNIPLLQIRLQENFVDVDISTFVQSALRNSEIPEAQWQTVLDAVPGRANGLFLYARLAVDAFLEPDAEVQQVLQKLPLDLNDLYTKLLEEHTRRTGIPAHIQLLILQAVTHTSRPLRLLEFAEMVRSVSPDSAGSDLGSTKSLIRTACGPLLEVLPDETVSVVHHSFTEYLKGTTRSPEDRTGYTILGPGATHAGLAIACLRYLKSGCLDGINLKTEADFAAESDAMFYGRCSPEPVNHMAQLQLNFPFYKYAAAHWHYHVYHSDRAGYDQTEINSYIQEFADNERNWEAWRQNNWLWRRSSTQLHVAASKGLLSYLKLLLKTAENPDVLDNERETPLLQAVSAGHDEVIRTLMEAGANPDHGLAESGMRPLHRAVLDHRAPTIKILLEAGVDPMTTKDSSYHDGGCCMPSHDDSIGDTPFQYACEGGRRDIVEVFLPYITNVEHLNRGLLWAAQYGNTNIVTELLEHPEVDVNHIHGGQTALFAACAGYHPKTVSKLLECGALPSIQSEKTGPEEFNCLHMLCNLQLEGYFYKKASRPRTEQDRDGLREVVSLLVEAGVDVQQPTSSGETPLHGAAQRGSFLTRLLLDAGADPNIQDPEGNAPLHIVIKAKKREEMVETMVLLVEHGGADINLLNHKGESPLLCMLSQKGYYKLLGKFLAYKPNLNTIDSNGDGPLGLAIKNYSHNKEILKAILAGGADPNEKNSLGIPHLLSMNIERGNIQEELDMLLEAGADINIADDNGQTLFSRFVSQELGLYDKLPPQTLKLLLDRGASPNTRDASGRTNLHILTNSLGRDCCWTKDFEHQWPRFSFLLDLGLDPTATDHNGNTLLHELAMCEASFRLLKGARGLWKRLVDLGLSLDQKNNEGLTPLHILCAVEFEPTHRTKINANEFVISTTKDLNAVDNHGVTLLHIAAAVNDSYVKPLLDAGADPEVTTHEGLTPLHLAARCRESNVVGLLIDALKKKWSLDSHSDALPAPGFAAAINASAFGDARHITPLFYACRSGRPETVTLLLEAGAVVDCENVFRACLEFAEEDALWDRDHQKSGAISSRELAPLKLDDKCRPFREQSFQRASYTLSDDETTRIDECVELLVRYGAGNERLRQRFNDRPHSFSGEIRQDHVSLCLEDALCRLENDDRSERQSNIVNQSQNSMREACIKALTDSNEVEAGDPNWAKFVHFLHRKEYFLIEELARMGSSFLSVYSNGMPCTLSRLVSLGFTFLVEKIGEIEANSRFHEGIFHAFGDKTRPGLWCSDKDVSKTKAYSRSLLFMAVDSKLPNMGVVRLLVEKFGVGVNDGSDSVSSLHRVSSGESWWKTRQALPYLLKSGGDANLFDSSGKTPLHVAISSQGQFRDEVITTLLNAGADINAVDGSGKSCLSYAENDISLIKRFLSHGAVVKAESVFKAILGTQISVLREFLAAGFNPNVHWQDTFEDVAEPKRIRQLCRSSSSVGNEIPLYIAAGKVRVSYGYVYQKDFKELESRTEVVRLLLDHGADPFAKFIRPFEKHEKLGDDQNEKLEQLRHTPSSELPEGYRECTTLHELFAEDAMVDSFVDIPGLDVDCRDANGRTLLLAACSSYRGPDNYYWTRRSEKRRRGFGTIFQKLVSLGASLEARDNCGRNVLHCMIGLHRHARCPTLKKAIKYTVSKAPHLMNQADCEGRTPLYYAANAAAEYGSKMALKFLFASGADPSVVTNNGDTILHVLAKNLTNTKFRRIFKAIANRGVNVNTRNLEGESPLFNFAERPKIEDDDLFDPAEDQDQCPKEAGAFPLLEELGADFFVRDNKGRGLLHAVAGGCFLRFKSLLDMGLDANMEDDSHQTPIDIATASGNDEILTLFENK